jgi:Ankyrin repeats (3 copies)
MNRRRLGAALAIVVVIRALALWFGAFEAGEQRQWDLSQAAAAGQIDKAKRLVDNGADVNRVPTRGSYLSGSPALIEAVMNGHVEVVKYLLDQGADIETGISDIRSPLAAAVGRSDLAMAKLLLSRGADANVVGSLDRSDLDPEMMKLLKHYGAIPKVIFREVPPMHLLCTSGLMRNDADAAAFAQKHVPEIWEVAKSLGAGVMGHLQFIYRGRRIQHASSYLLEIALPVYDDSYPVPEGYYYRVATSFKCAAGETKGPRKITFSGWSIVERAVWNAGDGPTAEVREVYRTWHGYDAPQNVLEVEAGLYGATPGPDGKLLHGHDDQPYVREEYE